MIQNQYVMLQMGYPVPKCQASKYQCILGVIVTHEV